MKKPRTLMSEINNTKSSVNAMSHRYFLMIFCETVILVPLCTVLLSNQFQINEVHNAFTFCVLFAVHPAMLF